jgi:gliding motility-associated-like protein
MRKALVLISFLTLSPFVFGQNLTGIWQGVLYQPNNPAGVYYFVYTMTILQTGRDVNLSSFASAYGTPYYAYYETIGTVNGYVLSFEDIAITDSQAPDGVNWCIKYGDLTFDPALEKLSGEANGRYGCPPFNIELYRLTIQADTIHCSAKNVPILTTGQNIRWYADKDKQVLLGRGSPFTPFVSQTTTYYVTQTIYDTESPVVPYTIHINSTAAYTQNRTICTGQSITTYRTSGTYVKKVLTAEGCDSIITTNLTVIPSIQKSQNLSICQGQSVTVGDTTYRTTGVYTKRLTSFSGCDSVVTTNLTVKSAIQKTQNLSICQGQSVTVGDTTYRTTGVYTKRFTSFGGCDSIVTTNLTVNSAIQKTQNLSICQGQSVTVGDTTYRTTGIYTKRFTSFGGCDSIVTTNLTVNSIIQKTQNLSICQGQSVTVGDTIYRITGVYVKRLTSFSGCDSVVTTNLTVNSAIQKAQNLSICQGQSVTVGDTTYRTMGVYIKRLTSFSGCDSIVTTNLTVNSAIQKAQNLSICQGQSVTVGDTIYRITGVYVKRLTSFSGCDSVVTTNLTVNSAIQKTQNLSICQGQSVTVGDTTYRMTGIYNKRLTSFSGCDSVITTNLTVNSVIQKTQNLSICQGQTIRVGDTTYRTTGIYTKRLTSFSGCDSVVTTNLTVNTVIPKTQNLSICQGQSVTIGDTIYRTTGIYTKRLTSFSGCDSVVTTNLTVNSAIQKTQNLSICQGQSVTVGDTIYRTTGVYTKRLTSFGGCDSVVTTNLTVNSVLEKKQDVTICQGQTIRVGDTTYSTSGTYIKKLLSFGGCDSVVTTKLNVLKFDLNMPSQVNIRLGDSVLLEATVSITEPLIWKWGPNYSLSCDTCAKTWAKPLTSFAYSVKVTDKNKLCEEQKQIIVQVNKDCNVFVPTAFSPNGDGVNDVFNIYINSCIKQIKRYALFSRWGNLITSNDNPINVNKELTVWDGMINGRDAMIGTYAYFFEVEYFDGKIEVIKGGVELVK